MIQDSIFLLVTLTLYIVNTTKHCMCGSHHNNLLFNVFQTLKDDSFDLWVLCGGGGLYI